MPSVGLASYRDRHISADDRDGGEGTTLHQSLWAISPMAYVADVCKSVSQKAADVHLLDHNIEMGPVLTCKSTPASLTLHQRRTFGRPDRLRSNAAINGHELMHQAASKHWGRRSALALPSVATLGETFALVAEGQASLRGEGNEVQTWYAGDKFAK